jgi:hypothetical protein
MLTFCRVLLRTVTGGTEVNIGGTSWTSCTATASLKPAKLRVSLSDCVYASCKQKWKHLRTLGATNWRYSVFWHRVVEGWRRLFWLLCYPFLWKRNIYSFLIPTSPLCGSSFFTNEDLRTESWQYSYYICCGEKSRILADIFHVLTTAYTVSVYIDCFSKSKSPFRIIVPFTVSGEARLCLMAKLGEPCKKHHQVQGHVST